jgi:hypothetical protein
MLTFSRHVCGYKSVQTISITLIFDGGISFYSHNKFIFDGLNPDVKFDLNELYKRCEEQIKKYPENLESYTINNQIIAVDLNGNLAVYCVVRGIVKEPYGESHRDIDIYVPIK